MELLHMTSYLFYMYRNINANSQTKSVKLIKLIKHISFYYFIILCCILIQYLVLLYFVLIVVNI